MLNRLRFNNATMGIFSSRTASERHQQPTGDEASSTASASTSTSTSTEPRSLPNQNPAVAFDLILPLSLFSAICLIKSFLSDVIKALPVSSTSVSKASILFLLHSNFGKHSLSFIPYLTIGILCAATAYRIIFGPIDPKCDNPGCRGYNLGREYDLVVQEKEHFNSWKHAKMVRLINSLPRKTDVQNLPLLLLAELRVMAPPGGRAVFVYLSKCGCPVSKIEMWGPRVFPRHTSSGSQ